MEVLILRVGCICVRRAIRESEFMGKEKKGKDYAFSIAVAAATVSTLYSRSFMRFTLHLWREGPLPVAPALAEWYIYATLDTYHLKNLLDDKAHIVNWSLSPPQRLLYLLTLSSLIRWPLVLSPCSMQTASVSMCSQLTPSEVGTALTQVHRSQLRKQKCRK